MSHALDTYARMAPRTQGKGPAPGGIDRVGRVVGRE